MKAMFLLAYLPPYSLGYLYVAIWIEQFCKCISARMEMALQGLQWKTCLVYIDDIIVFGRTFEEHVQMTEQVFEIIRGAGLKLKPIKCNMFEKEIIFLGHVVLGEGVPPSQVNIT